MFLREAYTPSSSPPSSPLFGPTDSSPSSSPSPAPHLLDSPPSLTGLSHPFAASSRATRRPPLYERKNLGTPPTTPPSGSSFDFTFIAKPQSSIFFGSAYEDDEYLNEGIGSLGRVKHLAPEDREMNIWDEAITTAFDKGRGLVELSSLSLTYIPQSIGDLANFFAIAHPQGQSGAASGSRLFSRIRSVPGPGATSPPAQSKYRLFERTASVAESSTGLHQDEIQLFLAMNDIRRLPRELFTVRKMTVLSLRNNKLTFIPPEISNLTHLQELNISNNQIEYLPSEMLSMNLQKLMIHPNRFLPEPTLPNASPWQVGSLQRRRSLTRIWDAAKSPESQIASPTTFTTPELLIPPLYEICLRVLLNSVPLPGIAVHTETNFSRFYSLPISAEYIPAEHVRDILNTCAPDSVSAPLSLSPNTTPRGYVRGRPSAPSAGLGCTGVADSILGTGTCPNPRHTHREVFVRHMEERFTWENTVAGIPVGGSVPIKWRGCLRGCLAFLDANTAVNGASQHSAARQSTGPSNTDADGDVEMDVDLSSVVQVVSLGAISFDDFDEDA